MCTQNAILVSCHRNWDTEQTEVVNPFEDFISTVILQQGDKSICRDTLDVTRGSKTFHGAMVDVDIVMPY